jgi:predicted P-loop ATPase/GTPase
VNKLIVGFLGSAFFALPLWIGVYVFTFDPSDWRGMTTWLYYSETNQQANIGITIRGKAFIGENYDRRTEAKRLLDMVALMHEQESEKLGGDRLLCRTTNYRFIDRGVFSIWPWWDANPPAPITEQHT